MEEQRRSLPDSVNQAIDKILTALDLDKDGTVSIQDIILLAVKAPGVHINRAKFLRKEFSGKYSAATVGKAIAFTPAQAGIPKEDIDRIADAAINFERIQVSGISAALGAPGGWAMAATVPADIVQYYGYTIRAAQKLLYLYGFPEIDSDEAGGLQLDTETINELILCLGIMNGVVGAHNAIQAMAHALAIGVEKKLLNTALTKGAFYPFVKSVMKWFGVRLTKTMFAGFFKKAIPVVGGFIGGGLTFATFKPCCSRLKKALQDTMLSNPQHVVSAEESQLLHHIVDGQVIDADYEEVSDTAKK